MRPSGREHDQLREIIITRHYTKHAEGSVLVEFGDTKVICTASVTDGVPRFLKGNNQGWLTAEYSMLPRATHYRVEREATRGKQGGRTLEIQRLIGRSLRSALDMYALGDFTMMIDCDVIQADGGTRTASITGACVAMVDALRHLQRKGTLKKDPLKYLVASASVGVYKNTPIIDLDYKEDSQAQTDMNVVMNDLGEFIEIQGTAETKTFSRSELDNMLSLAESGIKILLEKQREALAQ